MLTKLTWPSLVEFLYKFSCTHVAFRSFILCFQDGYNKALCNDELYLVKGGPASGSIILKSLDYSTKTIDDKDRVSLKQEFGENYKLLTKKSIYQYDCYDNIKKYNEEKIPDHTNFKNKLNNNKNISNEEYKSAHNVFKTFKCKNSMDYSILYLKTDVHHLANVFQKFSNFAYETYGLDCRYLYTLPGYSRQCMLKMTEIELDLISDQDMYLFFMDSIRGGICQVNKKCSKADNKYTKIQHNEWNDKKIKKKFKNK